MFGNDLEGYILKIGHFEGKNLEEIYWQYPPIIEGITWKTHIDKEPSSLEFTTVKVDKMRFNEGDIVFFYKGSLNNGKEEGQPIFRGRIFEKKRNKDHHIQVTCYDESRYFANQVSMVWMDVTATQVIKECCDYCGIRFNPKSTLTPYVMPTFSMQDQSCWDIVDNALWQTALYTGKRYFLYSDPLYGITVRNIIETAGVWDKEGKGCNILRISSSNASDFDYKTSIDSDTYNRIIMIDSETKAKSVKESAENINRWGLLQHVESGKTTENSALKLNWLYQKHNQVQRSLNFQGVLGDINVKAGSSVWVDQNLGDKDLRDSKMALFLVTEATHTFNNGDHFMELKVEGNNSFYA